MAATASAAARTGASVAAAVTRHTGPLKAIICPSILSADFSRLGEDALDTLKCGADWLHIDVMDGHFVPNLTIGAGIVKCLRPRTDAFFDCHLMVTDPAFWLADFVKAGANSFTFHVESYNDEAKTRDLIKKVHEAGIKCALSVSPPTPVEKLFPFLDELDMVLIMTVHPGFGGQSFMADMIPKVRAIRERCPNLPIQVDGGLDPKNIDQASEAGANVIVAGTSIFKAPDRTEVIRCLRESVQKRLSQ